ncbi:MAG: RNA polymerase sigma factor [Candidatus Nanoarchaeia archaeon]|jgi:RNA polymerase sigma factor (sigma-70 family)|nr:RNA polymerase sigma factor [Candidatus Nanoarchaeia archaeon]
MQRTIVSIQSLAIDFLEQKDNKTFSELIKRIKPGLISFIYKYVKDQDMIKEVVSKTFISVWEKLDQYNKDYNFSTWVYAIAKNEALGQLRGQSKTLSREKLTENHSKILKNYDPTISINTEVIGPSGEDLKIYLYEKTLLEIQNLEEPYKTVIFEREINNKRLQDIAEDLNWNLNTVKTRLRKARKDVADSLKQKHPTLIESYYEEAEEEY